MAEKVLFKGLRQVTEATYSGLTSDEKKGILWFVKRTDTSDNGGYGEIYLGERHYGHFGSEAQQIAALSGAVVSMQEEIGDLGLESGETLASVIESMQNSITTLESISAITAITLNGSAVTVSEGTAAITVAQDEYSLAKQDTAESGYASTYYLTKNGEQVGEKINVTKDQFLQSASYHAEAESGVSAVAPYLKFVWELAFGDEDSQHITYVPVSELVDTYTAGNAITISSDSEISVNVSEGKNYLKLNSSGNSLEVTSIDADATYVTSPITVAGGPLSDDVSDNWPSDWTEGGNKVIPSGLTLQEILTGLFLKTVTGTVGDIKYSWTPTMKNPTASLSSTGTVEVGSSIIVSMSANDGVNNPNATATASTSQGYFLNDSTDYTSGNYSQTLTGTAEGTPEVTGTFNGTAVANGDNVNVVEGTNTLSVSQSGKSCTVGTFASDVIYASTNTKSKVSSVSKTVSGFSYGTKALAATTASAKVTGAYKIYYGYTEAALDYSNLFASKDSCSGLSSQFMTASTASIASMQSTDGKPSLVLVLPASYTITGTQNSLGSDVNIAATWVEQNTFEYTNGNATTSYKVYVNHSSGAILYKNITISK